MMSRSAPEERSVQTAEQETVPTTEEAAPTDLSPGLSPTDLEALADRVYELLLRDLRLERERGAW
jgi:hypothetical protein